MAQTFHQWTPHLWTAQSELFHTNSSILISAGQACLIDPGIFPAEIAAIARFVEEQGARPVQIILTHSHWDHIFGPEHFPGVPVIAQAAYLENIHEDRDEILKALYSFFKKAGITRDTPITIPIPDRIFDKATTVLVGELTLRLAHAPGHAPDQLTVHHAASNTLWAADMLSDLETPIPGHSLVAYQHTLAAHVDLEAQVLVPGHGTPTTDPRAIRTRFEEDLVYLAELRANVTEALAAGKTLEETQAVCATMRYRHSQENAQNHQFSVVQVYRELGGPPPELQGT